MSSLVATRSGQIGIVESDTMAFEPITPNRIYNLTDIAVSPTGEIFASTFRALYKIDTETGSITQVGRFGGYVSINAIGFSPEGKLFGIRTQNSQIYEIDTETGDADVVFDIGSDFRSSGDIEFDPNTGRFYATSSTPVADTLYSISLNPETGLPEKSTRIGFPGFRNIWGLSSDDQGLIGYTDDRRIIRIDPETGVGELTGRITGTTDYIAGSADLPEATTSGQAQPVALIDSPATDELIGELSSPTYSDTQTALDPVTDSGRNSASPIDMTHQIPEQINQTVFNTPLLDSLAISERPSVRPIQADTLKVSLGKDTVEPSYENIDSEPLVETNVLTSTTLSG